MPVQGYKECIDELKDTKSKINEVDKQIKVKENAIKKNRYQDSRELEKYKEEIQDLKQKKDELEKKWAQLQDRVQLLGKINTKDKKISQLKKEMKKCRNQIKELERQSKKELEKSKNELQDLKGKNDKLETEIIESNNEIEDLKKKLRENSARTDSLKSKIEESKKSHQNQMEEMKGSYKKDMNEVKDGMAKIIQDLKESHNKEMNTLVEYRTSYEMNEDKIKELEKKNKKLEDELELLRYFGEDKHKLYIGQLCAELQTNLYRYVMPESCLARGFYYKIKDIENDIGNKEVIKDDVKREEASKRLENLKEIIDWKKLETLKESIKRLGRQRNQVAHPPNINKEGAIMAAKELQKQGKLGGRISIEKVKMIIEIWSVSKSLLHAR